MVNTKSKHSFFARKPLLTAVIILVLLLVGSFFVIRLRQNKNNGKDTSTTAADGSYVNLSPPTEQELSDTERHKNDIINQSNQNNSSSANNTVTPVITSANAQQVNAFVPGVFEEGGTCTATLTKGTETVTKTSTGFQNVSYTNCAPIDVSGALSKGNWSVVVSYKSATAEGKSQSKEFTVN